VLELSKLGHTRPVTIWSGAVDLLLGGHVAIGILVFLCSIVIPALKLIGILALDLGHPWRRAGTRRAVHRAIDWIGRWSMLDILLSMLASALFKPDLGATE
jgi:paraquat-inducible protein A